MEKKSEDKPKKKEVEVSLSTLIYSTLIVILGLFVAFGIAVYAFGMNNNFAKKIEKIIPYPAAMVGNFHFITIGRLNNNLDAVRKFYENQDFSSIGVRIDFSTNNGEKRLKIKEKEILNRMIEDQSIETIAKKKGLFVSNEMVDQNLAIKLNEYGTEGNLRDNLQKLYGWTTDDFKDKVIKSDLYRQELEKSFAAENPTIAEAKSQIEKAKGELDKKKDFGEVAKTYSKGSTAGDGGELGWFKKDQLIPEISDSVFSLEKGKRSDILESPLGFHIVELEDKKTENGADLVRIRQIFYPKKTFSEFLTEEMKKMKFAIFLKEYRWNKDKAVLEFKDEDMKKFEEDAIQNSQGDPTVIF